MDKTTLRNTLTVHNEHYDRAVKSDDVQDEFGKKSFPVLFEFDEPIYIARVTPAVHFTMGGLVVDRNVCKIEEKNKLQFARL